jgi:hypothetical protein
LDKKLIIKIRLEIEQIDQIFTAYVTLLEKTRQEVPDLVEVTAIGAILHSFYNGLESIFLFIAKEVDQQVPTGSQSHRDLLAQISQPMLNRTAVLSPNLTQKIDDYLSFRHFYRHSYSYFLDWNKLEPLVISLEEIWSQVKIELNEFLNRVSST